MSSDDLVALKSAKAQLEVGLIYLKRRHAELERQLVLVQSQGGRGRIHPDALLQLQRTVHDHAIQIERKALEIAEIDSKIEAAQLQSTRSGLGYLQAEHGEVTTEIADVRATILAALRELAEPLRHYEELVAKKNSLTHEIFTRTGRDQSYANYIEGALLRQSEYVGDLRYAVETLRRQRVVA